MGRLARVVGLYLVRTQTQVDAVELERRRGPSLSFSCCLIQPPQTRARTTRAIRQCSAECVRLGALLSLPD